MKTIYLSILHLIILLICSFCFQNWIDPIRPTFSTLKEIKEMDIRI